MGYDVRVEQAASRPLAVVRRRCGHDEFAKVIPEACGAVWEVVKSQQAPGAGRHVTVYLDCEFNLEIGVEVERPFAGHGEVVGCATPAGTVATTTHFGPYQELGKAHQAVQQWCQENGRALAGPSWEIYDHWREEWNQDPSGIRTDVYYLLK